MLLDITAKVIQNLYSKNQSNSAVPTHTTYIHLLSTLQSPTLVSRSSTASNPNPTQPPPQALPHLTSSILSSPTLPPDHPIPTRCSLCSPTAIRAGHCTTHTQHSTLTHDYHTQTTVMNLHNNTSHLPLSPSPFRLPERPHLCACVYVLARTHARTTEGKGVRGTYAAAYACGVGVLCSLNTQPEPEVYLPCYAMLCYLTSHLSHLPTYAPSTTLNQPRPTAPSNLARPPLNAHL